MSSIYYVDFNGPGKGLVGQRTEPSAEAHETKMPLIENDIIEEALAAKGSGQTMGGTYSYKEVSKLFEISEGRLRYWDKSGFISPSGQKGRRRCYTFQDLIGIRSAKTLLENGVTLQRARKLIINLKDEIPRSAHPLSQLRIRSDSNTVIVSEQGQDFEADSGQMLLDFDVKSLEAQVISELPSSDESSKEMTAYDWYLEGCKLDENEGTLGLAEEAYHRAIHLDPTMANAYTNLGNLLYRTGFGDDARALYEKAIEVDTEQPEAHYNLGFIEFEKGELDQALSCFSKAVELDSTFADAHFNLAITFLRLGQIEHAELHLHRYLNIEPTGPWADVARKRLKDISS